MERGQKMRTKTLSKDACLMLVGFSIPSNIIMKKWHSKTTPTLLLLTMSRIGMTNVSGTKTPLRHWPLFEKGKIKSTTL
jgi:hypothetical protein